MAEKQRPSTIDEALRLDNQLCYALHTATRRVIRAYQTALAELDLTFPQYLVLLILWECEQQRRPNPTVIELGERLDLDSGTLSPLLRRMESKGLIKRERPTGRELFVSVTAAGRALKAGARRAPAELVEQSKISPKKLSALCEQLRELRASLPWERWTATSD